MTQFSHRQRLNVLHAGFPTVSCLFAMTLLLSGCGGVKHDRPKVAPARGVVTYRGEPVCDAVLVFQPSGENRFAASAVTDKEGKYDIKAFPPESGAVPGGYSVMIMKVSQEDVNQEGRKGAKLNQPLSLIPAKYSNPGLSGLSVDVPPSGTESLNFDLID